MYKFSWKKNIGYEHVASDIIESGGSHKNEKEGFCITKNWRGKKQLKKL